MNLIIEEDEISDLKVLWVPLELVRMVYPLSDLSSKGSGMLNSMLNIYILLFKDPYSG